MALRSDMMGFPASGFPVLKDVGDRMCLNTLYANPLRINSFLVDLEGSLRARGITSLAAISAVGVAAGGAISGATTIAASGTVTLSSATAPISITGATAVVSLTGQNATIQMSGLAGRIGTPIDPIPLGYFEKLNICEKPTVDGVPLASMGDLTSQCVPYSGATKDVGLGDNDIKVNDNSKVIVGTDSDAYLTYDGTDAKIVTDAVSPSDFLIDCGTQKTLKLVEPVYDDLQVGINNIAKGTSAPTNRFYNHGVGGGIEYNVLGFAKNNFIWFDAQTSHSMKLNTVLECHIHFVLPNTTNIGEKIVFQLDVLASPITGTWAVPTGSPYTGTHTVAADDNTNHRILTVGNIAAVNTGVSTVYKCKLTRIDGTATEYASEVYVEYIDCHYQVDTMGSRQERVK